MSTERKLKKEFTTYWSQETVFAEIFKMSLTQAKFFDRSSDTYGKHSAAMIPDNIPFTELMGFSGHKTKVTIEVIP